MINVKNKGYFYSKMNRLWILFLGIGVIGLSIFLFYYFISGFGTCRLREAVYFKGEYYQTCAPIGTKIDLIPTYTLKIESSPWSGWSRWQPSKVISSTKISSIGQNIDVPDSGTVDNFFLRVDDYLAEQVTLTVNGVGVNQNENMGRRDLLNGCGLHTFTLQFLETAELYTCSFDGGVNWYITYL